MGRDDGERARPWADGAPRRARWKAPFVAPAYGLFSCGAPRYLRHALRHAQSAPRHAFPYRARSVAHLDILRHALRHARAWRISRRPPQHDESESVLAFDGVAVCLVTQHAFLEPGRDDLARLRWG